MEKKLNEYRARKEREAFINKGKQKIKEIFTSNNKNQRYEQINQDDIDINEAKVTEETNDKSIAYDINDTYSETSDTLDDNIQCCSLIDFVYYLFMFIVWFTMYMIFIKLQFGTIYLIISALIGIYLNTRTGPKRHNEISAYSVFNENCKSIDGTLKAEQLEREIGFAR